MHCSPGAAEALFLRRQCKSMHRIVRPVMSATADIPVRRHWRCLRAQLKAFGIPSNRMIYKLFQ
jgi:hypothetical protein